MPIEEKSLSSLSLLFASPCPPVIDMFLWVGAKDYKTERAVAFDWLLIEDRLSIR